MDEPYEELLHVMGIALERLTAKVSPAQEVPFAGNFVFRYVERTAQQAVVQKLARIITGLRAALLLVRNGLVQEQSVIERVLGELGEDVLFLAFGIWKGDLDTKLHKHYLDTFYQEEFDIPDNPLKSTQERATVRRKKIQAYLAAIGTAGNPSLNQEVARTLRNAFSGFVHAASPQIMEMYGGYPRHFYVYGMLNTPRMQAANNEIWSYFERGITVFAIAAGYAFTDRELFEYLASQKQRFEAASGRKPEDNIAEIAKLLKKKS